ncbi:hypothetical protein A3D81_01190 [Candidatus Curtissbacteria bacterium RIFCSPHIGHO2_02_FULL_40_17]|uniref:Glycosyltransferase RgtA/B/C/D-like domain-containing protein n=4 Tax=Candidatus Curtissiibacteriota TaxID=1752717 RepID=A0A1F5GHW2_9BACT|nr:MAG: hypothetical protein A2693_02750 [Candidatus Curtissbacteria bacterium RIFCSPHIGHO2_01_FULL_40_12]OGD91397.1 MAG: hypothetical protein A3D81_01190 [Candidatus Curtissbacteria bacterium RIFCSPHIGHO2_02_FULL_40_17]OGE04053.1 MAG: hypothetical protein A3F45_02875 [Candidatus Curtissbacteria bacterium RIFCSPHIGHO2_12_FULL_41_17]OGE08606.1 MAG: hypothetical protein A3I53_02445 [Candidatus Curtissbacteria bacterium RIFCSPLOWO2_02_FULL_40_13b]
MLFRNLRNFLRNILTKPVFRQPKYILLAIITLGFLLRINNLTIGFPILFVSNDEAIYHQSALNMLAEKTPFTIGNYGPLGAYLQIPFLLLAFSVLLLTGKIHSVQDMEFLLVTQEGYMLFIPRIISAMFGTLSIIAIYLLCVELFKNRKIALWASFFAAVSFNLVHISHLARGWSGAIFFSLLATLFVLRSVLKRNHALRNLLLSVFFASIAFGFHQIAGIVILLVGLIRIFAGKKIISIHHIFGALLWLFLVLVLNYFSVGGNFLKIIDPANPTVGLLKNPLISLREMSVPRMTKDFFLTDGLIVILTAVFFIKFILGRFEKSRDKRILFAFLIFIIFNFSLIVSIFPPFLRYSLVGISLLPLFAGFEAANLIERYKMLRIPFTVFIIFVASFNSIYWNLLLLREPTFVQVRKWVDKNIDIRIPIASTEKRALGYVSGTDARKIIRLNNKSYYMRAEKLVGKSYPINVREVLYIYDYSNKSLSKMEAFEKAKAVFPVRYVVDSYLGSDGRLLNLDKTGRFELAAHFSPTKNSIYDGKIPELLVDTHYVFPLFIMDRAGPYFDVLKVGR